MYIKKTYLSVMILMCFEYHSTKVIANSYTLFKRLELAIQ